MVGSIAPASGSTAGGDTVTIAGSYLDGATAVMFGSTPASSFTVDSAGQIRAVAPAGAAGAVDVTVVGPGGTERRVLVRPVHLRRASAAASCDPTRHDGSDPVAAHVLAQHLHGLQRGCQRCRGQGRHEG